MSLEAFRQNVRLYLRRAGYNQQSLAGELALHPGVLSRKLHGTDKSILTHEETRRITRTLAAWHAISSQDEAVELLDMVGLRPDRFTPDEWSSPPLNQLQVAPDLEIARSHEPFSKPKPPHNLPVAMTPLVGRAREVSAVRRVLEGDVRLLTLTGVGGVGKTRLALQVATDMLDMFADGVVFVNLSTIRDPEMVPNVIAYALGLEEGPNQAPVELISTYLRDKQMLLLLDNFEQVLPAARSIGEILENTRRLKVLVTSRATLRLRAEREFRVSPLRLPKLTPHAKLARSEAVQLFAQRARAARPDFNLTEETAHVVANICIKLDGLPLAIELAAAHSRMFSPGALLARLDSRLSLLTGGARDIPDRQQTLRQTLDWSYNLLTPWERKLFACLGVFVGSWDLCTAGAVCPNSEAQSVQDGLNSLAEQGMLVSFTTEDGAARFRMLQTLQEYALFRLRGSGEMESVRRRHAEYYVALAETAQSQLTGPRQKVWLDRLEQEHSNLRAALGWLHRQGESMLELRLASALSRFWYVRGYLMEGRRWLEEALSATSTERTVTRAAALTRTGDITRYLGEYERAQALHEEGLALSRELGDRQGVASGLNSLACTVLERGQRERAVDLFEESLVMSREIGDTREVAIVLANLGEVAQGQGGHERARELYEESLELRRRIGDTRGVAVELNNLGSVLQELGQYERSIEMFAESMDICERLGEKRVMARCLEGLATVVGARGDGAHAARLWASAEILRETIGMPLPPSERPAHERHVCQARSRIDCQEWEAAWREGRNMTPQQALDYAPWRSADRSAS